MPNAIKYNVSAETLALKKGNFWIGTGDVGKGPTSSTGFYNGITPPTGGYAIYLNKASGGPSIYTVNTEAQLTGLTNTISVTTNLVTNGGNFANGTSSPFDGVYNNAGGVSRVVSISNDRPYAGSTSTNALELNGKGGRVMYTTDLLTVGQTYTFSFWAKRTSGSSFTISWNNQNGSGETNSWSQGNINIATSWQRYSQVFTYNAARTQFYFYNHNQQIDNVAVFTEFQLSLGSSPCGPGITTASESINWFLTQTDKMVFNIDYPAIITNGLILNLDAGFAPSITSLPTNIVGGSYGGYTPTWYDISSGGNNGSLINGPTYSSANGGSIVFDGVDDYGRVTNCVNALPQDITIEVWLKGTVDVYNNALEIGGGGSSIANELVARGSNSALNHLQYVSWYEKTDLTTNNLISLSLNNGMPISPTQFSQHVVWLKGDGTSGTYLNGSLFASNATPTSFTRWYIASRDLYFGFGIENIAAIRIYNRALPAQEVLQNYTAMLSRFPILDFYSGSAISVSLRILSSSHTGYAIRVRRSSDNTEQDIGFVGGDLDTTSLLTFCGNSNGFVSRWYNQGTFGSYFQNTTATEQPMIVTGGTINTVNNKPAIFFDGIDDNLLGVGISAGYGSANFSVFGVGKRNGSGKYLTFIGTFEGYSGVWLGQGIDDKYVYEFPSTVGPGKTATATSTDTSSNQVYLTGIFDGTNSKVYKNGSEISSTQATGNYDRGFNYIGKRAVNPPNSYQRHMDGHMQEIISYTSNQTSNRINIEASIKNYYGI